MEVMSDCVFSKNSLTSDFLAFFDKLDNSELSSSS